MAALSLLCAFNTLGSDTNSQSVSKNDSMLRSALGSLERSEQQLREKFDKELAALDEARLKAFQQAFDRASSRRDTESLASLAAIINTTKDKVSANDDQIAEIDIAKGVDAVGPLRDGELAYSNRKYTWMGVPKNLPVSQFGLTPGGGRETIKGKVTSPGWAYIAISDEAGQKLIKDNLTDAGWEKTESTFAYTARGKTTMLVFKKHMAAGSFKIDRFDWSGPIVLLP